MATSHFLLQSTVVQTNHYNSTAKFIFKNFLQGEHKPTCKALQVVIFL